MINEMKMEEALISKSILQFWNARTMMLTQFHYLHAYMHRNENK